MQKRKVFSPFFLRLLPLLAIGAAFLFVLNSCINDDPKVTSTGPTCVTLTAKQINDIWVTPGYTKPGSTNQITWLQIYTSYAGSGTNFEANVHGMKADNTETPDSKIDMAAGTSCTVSLPNLAYSSNIIDVSKLDIFEADGTVKKGLSYVKFTPRVFSSDKTFLSYNAEVVYSSGAQAKGETLPCPPCIYCRPPCDTIVN
jgi:hypothetical protein